MTGYDEIRTYYNDVYYANVQRHRPLEHYDIYFKYLWPRGGNRQLLDVGCGPGAFVGRASKKGFRVCGIDISDKAVSYAKHSYPGCDLRVGRGEELPWPDRTFDAVTCLGSLEHFLDIPGAVREMARVGSPDAKFVVMVPNRDYPDWAGTEQAAFREERLSLEAWKDLLQKNGLKVVGTHADRWPVKWIPLPKRDPIKFIAGLYKKSRALLLPLERSYQFIFECRKNKGPL